MVQFEKTFLSVLGLIQNSQVLGVPHILNISLAVSCKLLVEFGNCNRQIIPKKLGVCCTIWIQTLISNMKCKKSPNYIITEKLCKENAKDMVLRT